MKTDWLRNDYLAATLIILLALAVVFAPTALHADSAEADAPTPISDNCEAVATVGLLEVYFCETDYGDLYVNSFGFMLEAD